MKIWVLMIIISSALVLAGCNASTEKMEEKKSSSQYNMGNPTPQEVLEGRPDANIMMVQDIVLLSGIDWVNEEELTKDELLLEITLQTDDAAKFVNGAANELPVGTKVYRVKERGDILIADTDKGDVRYYKLVEG
ncbi:hypothetical protein [Paenibacillus sp. NPDC057967]|uniref:hypothetical protein n=1 Tax=Paenibacillus sp. NPDC057967 TaxID=3346293 RepID=UPI0036DA4422